MESKLKELLFNICLVLLGFTFILLIFGGSAIQIPPVLQLFGRMHPLMLHFPIVLIFLVAIWKIIFHRHSIPLINHIGDWLLLITTLVTILTVIFGLFLSYEEGYGSKTVVQHKWFGVALLLVLIIWLMFRTKKVKKTYQMFFAILAMICVTVTGHLGSEITHGQNFVFEPLQNQKKEEIPVQELQSFQHIVLPIFEKKCMSCHGEDKMKGELSLASIQEIQRGGESGPLWNPDQNQPGLLINRLLLPMDDKEHMPPKDKPQLNDVELKLLKFWVEGGANFGQKVLELDEQDSLRMHIMNHFIATDEDQKNMKAVSNQTINDLTTNYRIVNRLAANSDALIVQFFGANFFQTKDIQELEKIKDNVVELNLNKMPIDDKMLAQIAEFKNLEKLYLSNTNITGESLDMLHQLKDLKLLSLSGTSLKDEALPYLSELSQLEELYLWNTNLEESKINALQSDLSAVMVDLGTTISDTVLLKLPPPFIKEEKQVLEKQQKVEIQHKNSEAKLFFTTDGNIPDSTSANYTESILIDQPTTIQAVGYLNGWEKSDAIIRDFYLESTFNDEIDFELVSSPTEPYLANGVETLLDNKLSSFSLSGDDFLAFRNNNFELNIDVSNKIPSVITLNSFAMISSYIFPPQRIELWGVTKSGITQKIEDFEPLQPQEDYQENNLRIFHNFEIPDKDYTSLTFKVIPVATIPEWHPGKGEPAWIAIDEIFLYE